MVKLDLEKAYDRVDWGFLKLVLRAFGFSDKWVSLLEKCWSNCWFSILVNVEAFSRNFRNLMVRGWSHPYAIGRGRPIATHMLFTDDTLLFLNGSKSSLQAVKTFLDVFQEASGQRINFIKSCFIYSGKLSATRIRSIKCILGIVKLRAGLRYLGVPLASGKVKCSDFQFLLDKVQSKHSIACYIDCGGPAQGHFQLGTTLCKVLLGWADGKSKLHWISWKKISRPFEGGGLGIRKLAEFLNALRMKLEWEVKFSEFSGLWAVLMRAKHGVDLDSSSALSSARGGSPLWRKIREQMALLEGSVQWQVGHGARNLWDVNWTGLGPLVSLVSSLILSELLSLQIKDFLRPLGPFPTSAVFSLLPHGVVDFIFQEGFATSDENDSCFWPLDRSGKFTIKSAWKMSRPVYSLPGWS
ncbi:uncharacterized protein LOC131224247 [Magnolia sinica]|uniref:uncharacterized protein LOC131224247 n=1 Tax=Magnolia sinica TaxID=86752 RepID=UPI0026591CD6|nr:uncharacterized protein LOC131224247 [Magnolia sinica]